MTLAPLRLRLPALFCATLLLAVLSATVLAQHAAAAGASRTWVSGVGDDAYPCSRTAPCKTLAVAISRTAEGGEINAVDSGGFGAVTITHGITIDLSSVEGGILNPATNGITVNVPANEDVILRGLDIVGAKTFPVPATGCANQGINGIRILSARSVTIENTTITEQSNSAIEIIPGATTNPKVFVNGVTMRNNCINGINVAPGALNSASVAITDSTIFTSGTGVRIADRAHAWLASSTVFGNNVGVATVGSGILDGFSSNVIAGNGTDGLPTTIDGVSTAAPVPTPTPAPAVATPPVAAAAATPAKSCIVPKLVGTRVAKAARKLKAANCTLGRIKRVARARGRSGVIISTSPAAGTKLAAGAKVRLVTIR